MPIPGPRRKADDPSPNYGLNVDGAEAAGEWAPKNSRSAIRLALGRRHVPLRVQVGDEVVASVRVARKSLDENFGITGAMVKYRRGKRIAYGIVVNPVEGRSPLSQVVVSEVLPNQKVKVSVPVTINSIAVKKALGDLGRGQRLIRTNTVVGRASAIPGVMIVAESSRSVSLAARLQITGLSGREIEVVEGGDLGTIEAAAETIKATFEIRAADWPEEPAGGVED